MTRVAIEYKCRRQPEHAALPPGASRGNVTDLTARWRQCARGRQQRGRDHGAGADCRDGVVSLSGAIVVCHSGSVMATVMFPPIARASLFRRFSLALTAELTSGAQTMIRV